MKTKNILFVCLGNICRSPAAEGIFRKKVQEKGLQDQFFIDSAGTMGYHEGELPDSRMRAHAAKRGYCLNSYSRPVIYSDFFEFDLIIAMDNRNYDDLIQMAPDMDAKNKVVRMTDYCTLFKDSYVPDPYYGGAEGFEHVLNLLEDACEGLIESLKS